MDLTAEQSIELNKLTWDIRDPELPKISTFDEFQLWPDGHCQMVYDRSKLNGDHHKSGWAMRNTNNHDPKILKKSCVGVLMCNLQCVYDDGKARYHRPGICDKVRNSHIGTACPNEKCKGGILIHVPCRGHYNYPVTHFWRTEDNLVYFQAKGTHDHPQPGLKSLRRKREVPSRVSRKMKTLNNSPAIPSVQPFSYDPLSLLTPIPTVPSNSGARNVPSTFATTGNPFMTSFKLESSPCPSFNDPLISKSSIPKTLFSTPIDNRCKVNFPFTNIENESFIKPEHQQAPPLPQLFNTSGNQFMTDFPNSTFEHEGSSSAIASFEERSTFHPAFRDLTNYHSQMVMARKYDEFMKNEYQFQYSRVPTNFTMNPETFHPSPCPLPPYPTLQRPFAQPSYQNYQNQLMNISSHQHPGSSVSCKVSPTFGASNVNSFSHHQDVSRIQTQSQPQFVPPSSSFISTYPSASSFWSFV